MRLTAQDYEGLLDNPNVQRALASIRAAEGTARKADPYSVGFGFSTIADLSDHPGTSKGFTQKNGKRNRSTAAGAYQHLASTWNQQRTRLGLPDFSPKSQDISAVSLIDQAGALDNVLAGDIKGFAKKAGGTWASMPGAPARYSQPKKSYDFVEQAWNSYAEPVTDAPRPKASPFGLLSSPEVVAASSVPAGLLATTPADKGARVASLQSPSRVPTPTARPTNTGLVPTVASVQQPDSLRYGHNTPMQATRAQLDRYAANMPKTQIASTGLTPAQEANLSDRLGQAQPSAPSRIASSLGGLLGVTPAAAAEMPSQGVLNPSTGFAGATGSPRSLEGRLPANALGGLLSPAGPRNVPAPTAAPRDVMPAYSQTRTIGPAPTVAQPTRTPVATPQRTQVATDAWGGLRTAVAQPQSYAPAVPTVDRPTSRPEEKEQSRSWQQKAAVVGASVLGGAVAGPVGGLLGGFIGNQMVKGGLLSGTQRPAAQSSGGYASSLPSRPSAPTKSQRDALDRDIASRGGMGKGPSISAGARSAISGEKAAGKGPSGLY